MGRVDDVINAAGHRLSTGQMEEVLASHPAVAECAVIGVYDSFKGQIPRRFVVLKAGVSAEPDMVSAEGGGALGDGGGGAVVTGTPGSLASRRVTSLNRA